MNTATELVELPPQILPDIEPRVESRVPHPNKLGGHVYIGHGVSVELLVSHSRFLGIGQVAVDGFPLRSAERPLLPEIRNPDAVYFDAFYLEERIEILEEGGIRLRLGMSCRKGGPMEWMLHTVRPRYNREDWSKPSQRVEDTSLTLEIRPVRRIVNGETAVGFSYRYLYASSSIPIYKILDRATWEPEGRAVGNELWLRNGFSTPIKYFGAVDDAYSSEWFLPSATNPNVFDFLPFQTQLSGFTMTAHAEGVLVTWVPQAAHVRSLFEKPRTCDQIVHLHELCADLSLKFIAPPIEVLWFAGERDRTRRINLYESVRSLVSETLHAQVGMRIDRATSYGVIEEWQNADLRRYADKGLPELIKSGCQTVFLPSQFENNMNAYGVTNMCCTTDLRVAESVGESNLAYFCEKAKAAGINVEMWGNTSLSTIAWLVHRRDGNEDRIRFEGREKTVMEELDKARDPWVRNPSNAIEADHYTPVFLVMNLRDETVRRVWSERWRDARERLGLGGIFLDSSFNLSSDKFHWIARPNAGHHGGTADQTHLLGHCRPAEEPQAKILSQYLAHLTLMAEMQEMGYTYSGEDTGVFGVHRAGAPTAFLIESLPIWVDCLPDFEPLEIAKLGRDPADIFFRGLAYRAVWKLHWDPTVEKLTWIIGRSAEPEYAPTVEQLAFLRAYARVHPYMAKRHVLSDEQGVLYRGGGKTVLWSFASLVVHFTGKPAQVHDLLNGRTFETSEFTVMERGIFLLETEQEIVARVPSDREAHPQTEELLDLSFLEIAVR